MKNEQKYKTPEERVEAFDRWRRTIKCEGCSQMCDTCEAGPLADECGFKWLALEAVGEEKVADCNHLGNAAKMREAFENIAEYAKSANCHTEDSVMLEYLNQIESWAESALSSPPRNCDVGTADEQVRRHLEWCERNAYKCQSTPSCAVCLAEWEQMPYEEGDEK